MFKIRWRYQRDISVKTEIRDERTFSLQGSIDDWRRRFDLSSGELFNDEGTRFVAGDSQKNALGRYLFYTKKHEFS